MRLGMLLRNECIEICNSILQEEQRRSPEAGHVVEQDGVRVFIDPLALMFIVGSTMDYVESKINSGFVFDNPNVTGQCGCGESFSV